MTNAANPQSCPDDPTTITTDKVCIIGSGNWGSAIATIVGHNSRLLSSFHDRINMWVYEEQVPFRGTTRNLSEIINETHENTKYLPNIKLPETIVAVPDLAEACRDATLLIFVLPHQFLPHLFPIIQTNAHAQARGVSLIKGLDFDQNTRRPLLISEGIAAAMGFSCGVLMGANVANEVAAGKFCESTLASNFGDVLNERTRQLFETDQFRVHHSADVAGAEVYGALKNTIALGAGFVDALQWGGNTKAALLRVGLHEMSRFGRVFFDTDGATILESCGVADLITTCYGGRNRRVAEQFALARLSGKPRSWEELEVELLDGQKLQGTLTIREVYQVLESRELLHQFPLLRIIYEIAFRERPIDDLVVGLRQSKL